MIRIRKTTRTLRSTERRGVPIARSREDRWQIETLPGGVRLVRLAGALDTLAARQLLHELCDDRWRQLIVDLHAGEPLRGHAPGLLTGVFMERIPTATVVVVAARGSALERLLPTSVPVAFSLQDACRLVSVRARRRDLHAPVRSDREVISATNRHALAVRQALRWAAQAAAAGEYEAALRALDTMERIEGSLDGDWRERRQAWQAAATGDSDRAAESSDQSP